MQFNCNSSYYTIEINRKVDADIVISVPDSGTTAAIGYAEESCFTNLSVYEDVQFRYKDEELNKLLEQVD